MRLTPYKGREYTGGPVEVYRNLHRDQWSVRAAAGEHKGKVIGHAEAVVLKNATFVIQSGGQRRHRRTGVRNVHAWVSGTPLDLVPGPWERFDWVEPITYRPGRHKTFVRERRRTTASAAELVCLDASMRCLARGVT